MHAYVDTSVLVSIYFADANYSKYIKSLKKYNDIYSSILLEAELCSVVAREEKNLDLVEKVLSNIQIFSPNKSILPECERVLSHGYLRGADLYHLACALAIDPSALEMDFISADKKQIKIAKSLGFKTLSY
ncbi:MAG: type II toxin-antitoxin system VapC family toxin [Bdellovibrionales bacterium]|nr:type II toxin-antitoxin system VapC family toxin [Bdellovibrionales bacterium]